MKRILILCLFTVIFAACKKGKEIAPATPVNNIIAGKWSIISVTVIPRDSTGKAINSGTIYSEPSYYFFQFNTDNTWVENLDPTATFPIGETGRYVMHADTSFTLINVNLPSSAVDCKIISFTNTSFIFSHQKVTLFNGVTPGRLEYIFKLKK